MEIPRKIKNEAIIYGAMGLLISILGATVPIDIGLAEPLSSLEAWRKGIAPVMSGFGLLLVLLNYYLLRGAYWIKWPIILWLPVFFLTEGIVISGITGEPYTEFIFSPISVLLIALWLWSTHRFFKKSEVIEYISRNELH